jgi:malonate transporter MadL subunit
MIIYGVAILSLSMLAGVFLGDLLGFILDVEANVGGVGIAMLVLLFLSSRSGKKIHLGPMTADGITFWSAMYIPIVIAMAAKQDVYAALKGGPVALLAGTLAVAGGFALVPVLSRWHKRPAPRQGEEQS